MVYDSGDWQKGGKGKAGKGKTKWRTYVVCPTADCAGWIFSDRLATGNHKCCTRCGAAWRAGAQSGPSAQVQPKLPMDELKPLMDQWPEALAALEKFDSQRPQTKPKTRTEARVFAESAAKVQQKLKQRDKLLEAVAYHQRMAKAKEEELLQAVLDLRKAEKEHQEAVDARGSPEEEQSRVKGPEEVDQAALNEDDKKAFAEFQELSNKFKQMCSHFAKCKLQKSDDVPKPVDSPPAANAQDGHKSSDGDVDMAETGGPPAQAQPGGEQEAATKAQEIQQILKRINEKAAETTQEAAKAKIQKTS